MKKIIACTLLTATTLLIGCNTVQGIGKDVERAGEKVQDIGRK